ncbi:hypothetical protein K1719_034991 [Acacia pycnantha]|nr:hypothetical protein K1719_034991 [Acacia pycnantha]
MDERQNDAGPAEQGPSNSSWWPSDFVKKFGSVSLGSQEETLNNKESPRQFEHNVLSPNRASQILWRTGMLSEPIPNGFYSVIPDKRLKEIFDNIPTMDEIHVLGGEGLKADVILVDTEKDKKLSMLKQLIVALVKGLSSNPAAIIKKIAGLVSDFYKRSNVESPAKAALEENSHIFENRGVQILGQIKNGSCRCRAILFKVLADTVGLESTLMVGFPYDGDVECMDSYKHMSVLVVLNSVELLVDLMRCPGQLLPRSNKEIFMSHISAAGESDSAENDSCDSPLEPNSPLYGVSEKVDPDSAGKEENLPFQRRFDTSSNISGLSLRNLMLRSNTSLDRKLSFSHSEPNIAIAFGRRSRRKVIAEQRTASSSPEHPSIKARGQSILSGDRKSFREFADDEAASRSDGASPSEARRIRRRSISITPEIGDDIVRAVRAMNETLKQNRLLTELGDNSSFSPSANDTNSVGNLQKNMSDFLRDGVRHLREVDYREWNIDFSEIIVGTRVGIGFFGEVFRGVWNGTEVAIKVFLEQDLTAENMEDFCNEISILSRLRHPNVILFLGACTKPPRLSMVTEYMERGSLYYLIHVSGQKKKLNWQKTEDVARYMQGADVHTQNEDSSP